MSVQGATSSVEVGQIVDDRYRLEEHLGDGGFGTVFRASRLDTGRQVALKLLRGELLDSEKAVRRFLREARLAQQLEHPNTVRCYDSGQTRQGLPYIAFEILEGRSLGDVLEADGPMPVVKVARIAAQVLKSLMEAHELGIVHRDIKPENIYLTDIQGEPDFVRVLDFGIAKSVIAGGTLDETMLTAMGEVIGTPSYMAPEQVRGEEVGPTTDLYALGLVMAELLTGRVVFSSSRPLDVYVAQTSDAPVPLGPEVMETPLGPAIAVATAKRAEERYRFAGEMLADIEDVLGRARSEHAESPPLLLSDGRSRAPSTPGPGSLPSREPLATTTTEPSGRSRLIIWLAVIVGVLIVTTAVLVGLTIVSVIEADRSTAPHPARENESSIDSEHQKVAALTVPLLRQRLELSGWRVETAVPVSAGLIEDGTSLTVTKGHSKALVQFFKCINSHVTEHYRPEENGAYHRRVVAGSNVLIIMPFYPSDEAARQAVNDELFTAIVR